MLFPNPPNRNNNHQLPIFWTACCVDQGSGTRQNPIKNNSDTYWPNHIGDFGPP